MQTTTTLRNGITHGRIILGGWQFSDGHSLGNSKDTRTIPSYLDNGVDAIDCADIYTGVEEIIGEALRNRDVIMRPRIHTKHVPDLEAIQSGNITLESTRFLINRSLHRLGVTKLDLVQFHHWDYSIDTYITTIHSLLEMQYEGKIGAIGVTNTSVSFLEILRSQLGFIPVTTQNQYNIIDRRVELSLQTFSLTNDIGIYAYGCLMGGLLGERYYGATEPKEPLENRSLRKYLQIIADWGDWKLFQELLSVLKGIADKHSVSISDIAMHWVLTRPGVSAIIVGGRHPRYAPLLKNIFTLSISEEDMNDIEEIYASGNPLEGDVFELERNEPRHRDIMKFNLNEVKK